MTKKEGSIIGQYHILVNLSKQEFASPHQIGLGLKMREQIGDFAGSMGDLLYLLVACSHARGGGDVHDEKHRLGDVLGRWTGDKIAVVGDYSTATDIPGLDASVIYNACFSAREPELLPEIEENNPAQAAAIRASGQWTDITPLLVPLLEDAFGIGVRGQGWKHRYFLNDNTEQDTPMAIDVLIRTPHSSS